MFHALGQCRFGDTCKDVHGDLCTSCNKRVLHPFRREEAERFVQLFVNSQPSGHSRACVLIEMNKQLQWIVVSSLSLTTAGAALGNTNAESALS